MDKPRAYNVFYVNIIVLYVPSILAYKRRYYYQRYTGIIIQNIYDWIKYIRIVAQVIRLL